jgi:DNA polymerase-3 subunit alpha
MTALMSYNADDDKMMPKYFGECNRLKLKISNPNINKSTDKFQLGKNRKIISPLTLVKTYGEKAYSETILARGEEGFETFEDFYDKVNKRILNVRIVSNMILAGCFKSLEDSIENTFDQFIELRGKDKVARQFYCKHCDFRYPCSIDLSKNENENIVCPNCASNQLSFEDDECKGKKFNLGFISTQVFGFSALENPLKRYVKQIEESNADSLDVLNETEENCPVGIAIYVVKVKKHVDKNNHEMAFIGVSDGNIEADLVVFASDWEELKDKIQVGCCYLLVAYKNRGNGLLFNTRSRPKSKLVQLGL